MVSEPILVTIASGELNCPSAWQSEKANAKDKNVAFIFYVIKLSNKFSESSMRKLWIIKPVFYFFKLVLDWEALSNTHNAGRRTMK